MYYNYALRRSAQEAKPTTLHVVTDTGEINIIDNKQQMYKKEIEMSQQHMGKGRGRWYKHKGKLFPVYANTAEGIGIRKKIQEGTLSESEWKKVPERIREVLRSAEACTSRLTGTKMNGKMYGNIFTANITLQELDKFIARCKKNTAPGVSGIRIDHIAALPDHIREATATVLSIPYPPCDRSSGS